MSDLPTTRPSLILRVKNHQDHDAWAQFTEIYTPLVYRYARKRGMQDADAADIAQDVLTAIAKAMPQFQYDPTKGLFRGWLYTVVRNKVNDHLSRRRNKPAGSGQTQVKEMLEQHPAPNNDEDDWNLDYQRRLFDWAAQIVRPKFREATWNAFWQTAVENKPPKEVAESLGMTVGAIYIAKSRVITQLRETLQDVAGNDELPAMEP